MLEEECLKQTVVLTRRELAGNLDMRWLRC